MKKVILMIAATGFIFTAGYAQDGQHQRSPNGYPDRTQNNQPMNSNPQGRDYNRQGGMNNNGSYRNGEGRMDRTNSGYRNTGVRQGDDYSQHGDRSTNFAESRGHGNVRGDSYSHRRRHHKRHHDIY